MKRIFIAGAFILFAVIVNAQNVGIGTPMPVARLQINHRSSTTVGLQLLDSTALRSGTIRFSTINNPVGITMRGAYESSFNKGHYLDIISDSTFIATFRGDGNVGIGEFFPTAKLHVNGAMKIEGLNTLEFGAGVAGKEINAGKIGYNSFGFDGLSIVGSGTTAVNRKVYIFAEGGTTFNGPINVGGSTGTTGQVLTSNGIIAPTWENTSFNNNVRFEVDFNGSSNTLIAPPVTTTTTVYNFNPALVFIGSTSFSVSRSGLYHIEGFYDIEYIVTGAPPTALQYAVALKIGGRNYPILNGIEPYDRDLSTGTSVPFIYRKFVRFVNEVYLSAPIVINFSILPTINLGPASFTSTTHFGKISGYLISD